jgi:GTPase SAR1 family protein
MAKELRRVKNPRLEIGVHDNLTQFQIKLEPLTRGLVVVGQSGCGKSFLLGRIVEEIIRNTGDKTRLLIIDANSDFSNGLELKLQSDFKSLLDTFNTGLYKDNYKKFFDREIKWFKKMPNPLKEQVFGRTNLLFNLSWEWLVNDQSRFLRIVKGGQYNTSYYWALVVLIDSIKGTKSNPKTWIDNGYNLRSVRGGASNISEIRNQINVEEEKLSMAREESFIELLQDLSKIKDSPIIRDQNQPKLPDTLFELERINYLEIDQIPDKQIRTILLTSLLEFLFESSMQKTENVRHAKEGNNRLVISKAKKEQKHTFILLDEAHNFAAEDPIDPLEKGLGEIIHRIAAEGRKYGLHIIISTQRPSKIKQGLLGECDNAIIMKMNSRMDLDYLAQEMRVLESKLLEPCLHFQEKGEALAIGEMTGMAPYINLFKAAPRRSKEGGVDIEGF